MTQDPDGFAYVTDHDYDPNGNEKKLTDPKGQVIDYTYDELNRLKAKIYHLTPADMELYTRTHRIDYVEYDENNNLKQIDELMSSGTDPPAVVSSFKTYDNLDRLETETDSYNKTLTYDYDDVGNRTLLIDPDNQRTVYEYDVLNRLETVRLEEGTTHEQRISYQYYPDGLKKTVTNPNNTVSNYVYDDADRLTNIAHTGPSGVISSYVYGYDANSNREYQSETNAGRTETTSYTYDFVNRLETVTYEDGTASAKTTTYTYDKAGNRLTEQEVEVATSNVLKDLVYDYDEINRLGTITDNLDAAQNVAYTYDPNGNTLSKTKNSVTTNFKYDVRDQLGEVLQGSNVLGRYGYDYDGRRILKIGDEGRVHYTYDQLSVVTEASDTGQTVSKYDYGLDQLVSLNNRVEGRSFFHLDALRSTVNLTDGSGSARQSILYDAWGNERERVGVSANKFTFTGHEKDEETGLIYAKARFYDADIGRFLNQDTYLGDVGTPPSLHRYTYTHANPLRFIDPQGLAVFETRDLDNLTYELKHYSVDEGESYEKGEVNTPGYNKVGDPIRVRRPPTQVLVRLLEMTGSKEAALRKLDDLKSINASTFATVILEPEDFNEQGQLLENKVFGEFVQQVGSYSLAIDGLRAAFLSTVTGAGSDDFRDISLAYNVAYDFSAASAHAFAEHESSDIFFVGGIQRKASLLGQGLYKTAPSDFKLTYGTQLLLDTASTASLGLGIFKLGRLGFNALKALRGHAANRWATGADEAVFWSGIRKGDKAAAEWVARNGG